MRIANLAGRAVLVTGDRAVDIETVSGGQFGSDVQALWANWSAFSAWAAGADLSAAMPFAVADLQAPVPAPRQIFAIGLNYKDHADEASLAYPDHPVVFTKFQSSIAGPTATITVPEGMVDYEIELVVVVGKEGHRIPAARALDHVAGYTVGQDISERIIQRRGPAAQFSLGKSFPNFTPIGPWVATLDEFADPNSLGLRTELERADGTVLLQDGNTRELIFSVTELIVRLSEVVTLYAGDVIFTGTPAGVGMGRTPQVFLEKGQTLVSTIEGIGELRNPIA